MKTKLFCFLAAVICFLPACNTLPLEEEKGTKSVSFRVKGASMVLGSKSNVIQTQDESAISRLDIAIYDVDGNLEWDHMYKDSAAQSFIDSSMKVTGLKAGKKTICVSANNDLPIDSLTKRLTLSKLSDFQQYKTTLSDNTRKKFVMFGSASEVEAKDNPTPATIKISRIVSKICIDGNVSEDWAGIKPVHFSITDIYVANAVVNSTYSLNSDVASRVNKINEYETKPSMPKFTDVSSLKDFLMVSSNNWESGKPYLGEGNSINFYTYPNASNLKDSTNTVVILKALYQEKEDLEPDVCYYKMKIADGKIESNKCYLFHNITITAKGTNTPEEDFTKVVIHFSLEVKDWDVEDLGNIDF